MRAKVKELMNGASTSVNSTGEGYGMARKVKDAVFIAEKPSTDTSLCKKPCDLVTSKRTRSKCKTRTNYDGLITVYFS